ncbi:NAD kinase [Flavicella sp.]|uniref:NAD kinase n=1 Tax=Flavicella sp. TaxID=2957742 RepID=UPI00261E4ADE|nr:NAD kinase [Flavicella sp.]MDG1803996.1 NAD kinase [Flavicella sp.]
MNKVAIFGQAYKNTDRQYFEMLIENLNKFNIEILIYKEFVTILDELGVANLNYKTFQKHEDLDSTFDLLFTLGGDGTILNAATLVKDLNIPILGINTGRLGFLATVQKKEIENTIQSLIKKEFTIQERAVLQISTNDENIHFNDINFALNEVTIARKNSTSMIGVEAYLNDEYLTTYWSDGLVVATPTGSTGYSLSCHGPIIMPESNNFVLTPIAPHNLSARPLVIPDTTEIKLKIIGREKEFFLSLDSRVSTVPFEIELTLTKANFPVKIIQLNQQTFIGTLREKLFWGEDKRNYTS